MKVRFENEASDWLQGLYIVPETEFEKHWLRSNYQSGDELVVSIVDEPYSEQDEHDFSPLDFKGLRLSAKMRKESGAGA